MANITTNIFNQSIPITIINILFSYPVNLTNLHQSWLVNRTRSLSNVDVAAEIYVSSVLPGYSVVYL